MSKAAELAALIGSQSSLSNRNLIINGAMQVWQRATSSTGALSNAYATADRWNFHTRSCTTRNISQEAFTVGQTDVSGNPEYYLRSEFSNDSGSTGPFIMQRIEDVRTGSGQTLTLSFWAKADASQTITPNISQQFGSGGSSAVDTGSTPSTVTVGTSWERHTVTFNVPSISGKTIGSSSYLRVDFRLPANTAITFDIAQVQLELGEQATPFEHRSFGDELQRCLRYYQSIDTNGRTQTIGFGHRQTTNTVRFSIPTPVALRADPSISISGTVSCQESDGSSTATTSISGLYNSNGYVVATGTASGVVLGSITVLGALGAVQIDAEL